MTDDPEKTPQALEIEAIQAIARTPDGVLLHRYLRRVLETVYDTPDDSALRSHNGRRSLARDLMRHMAEGLDDHRTDSTVDAPILARPGGGTNVAGRARRDRTKLPRVDSLDPAGPDPADGSGEA